MKSLLSRLGESGRIMIGLGVVAALLSAVVMSVVILPRRADAGCNLPGVGEWDIAEDTPAGVNDYTPCRGDTINFYGRWKYTGVRSSEGGGDLTWSLGDPVDTSSYAPGCYVNRGEYYETDSFGHVCGYERAVSFTVLDVGITNNECLLDTSSVDLSKAPPEYVLPPVMTGYITRVTVSVEPPCETVPSDLEVLIDAAPTFVTNTPGGMAYDVCTSAETDWVLASWKGCVESASIGHNPSAEENIPFYGVTGNVPTTFEAEVPEVAEAMTNLLPLLMAATSNAYDIAWTGVCAIAYDPLVKNILHTHKVYPHQDCCFLVDDYSYSDTALGSMYMAIADSLGINDVIARMIVERMELGGFSSAFFDAALAEISSLYGTALATAPSPWNALGATPPPTLEDFVAAILAEVIPNITIPVNGYAMYSFDYYGFKENYDTRYGVTAADDIINLVGKMSAGWRISKRLEWSLDKSVVHDAFQTACPEAPPSIVLAIANVFNAGLVATPWFAQGWTIDVGFEVHVDHTYSDKRSGTYTSNPPGCGNAMGANNIKETAKLELSSKLVTSGTNVTGIPKVPHLWCVWADDINKFGKPVSFAYHSTIDTNWSVPLWPTNVSAIYDEYKKEDSDCDPCGPCL